jgi:hypothetical protein
VVVRTGLVPLVAVEMGSSTREGWMSAFCRTISVAEEEEEEEGGQAQRERMRAALGAGRTARGVGMDTEVVETGVKTERGRVTTGGKGHTPDQDHVRGRGRDHHGGREGIRLRLLTMTEMEIEPEIGIETGIEERGKSSGHIKPP